MIEFKCPSCNEPMEFADNLAGQTVSCPACGRPCQVPESGEAVNRTSEEAEEAFVKSGHSVLPYEREGIFLPTDSVNTINTTNLKRVGLFWGGFLLLLSFILLVVSIIYLLERTKIVGIMFIVIGIVGIISGGMIRALTGSVSTLLDRIDSRIDRIEKGDSGQEDD